MSDKIGSLEYDVKIREAQLKKDIESIEAQLTAFNTKATKLMTIDAAKTSQLINEQKALGIISATESKRLIDAAKLQAIQTKNAENARRNAALAEADAARLLILEERLRQAKLKTGDIQTRVNKNASLAEKEMQGMFKESIADITRKNDQLKIMANEYARLEKESNAAAAAEAKREKLSSSGRFKEYINSLTKTNDELAAMSSYYKRLEKDTDKYYNNLSKEAKEAANAEKKAAIQMEKNAIKAEKLAKAKQKEAIAQRKAAQSIISSNSAYRKQSLYLQNLNTMAANYVSVFAALNLGRSIAQTTGEFELQRKALAAIIQSKEQADQLFNKVTELALQSPFSIKGLLGYTKMLAAYRVESDNLISTLSKLGDVSAGLGVDMSRLILAFGQVKAASVLRGQEVRQFTEAGIPVIGLLADKFSELEGRVISTNEVFDRISKRMVSFQMVSEIFDDMTAKGGVFFEAQRVQAETLAGMMSIFTDAMHKAFAGIGNDNEDFFKGVVGGATELLNSWQEILRMLRILIAGMGTYRIALLFLNKQRTLGNILIKNNVRNLSELTAVQELAARKQIALAASGVKLSSSFKKLGIFMRSNAILLGVTAFAAIGTAIYEAYRQATKFNRELDALLSKSASETMGLINGFTRIADAAVEAADGSKKQRDALDELRRTYKDYIPKQNLDIKNLKKLKDGYDDLTEAINKKAAAQAREKGFRLAESEFQESTTSAYDKLYSGLLQNGIIENDAKNIAKIFKEQITDNPDLNPVKLLEEVTSKYLNKATEFTYKTEATSFAAASVVYTKAANGAFEYADALKDLSEAQAKVSQDVEIKFGLNTQQTKAEREVIDGITLSYNKQREALYNVQLTKEEYAKKSAILNAQELADKIAFYSFVSKGEDDAYNNKKIQEYTTELNKLNKEGSAYEKLINKIINKATGGSTEFGIQFKVSEGEDVSTHMKRIVSEYKTYKQTITETENVIQAYQSTQQKGWKSAVSKSEIELSNLKKNLSVVEAIAKALKINLSTTTKKGSASTVALNNIKAQYKFYKQILKSSEDFKKNMGSNDADLQISKIYREQAKKLKIDIPVSFDTQDLVNKMLEMAKKADNIGTSAGKNLATSMRTEAAKFKADELVKATAKGLARIDEEIKAFKEKNDLYKYIFGITKDDTLAFKIAFDVDTKNLEQVIRSQIESIDADVALKMKGNVIGKSFGDLFSESDVASLEEKLGVNVVKNLRKAFEQLKSAQRDSFNDSLKTLSKALEATESNEQKILKIKEKYVKLRAALELKYAGLSDEELAKRLAKSRELESAEISGITSSILAATDAYKALYSDMERYSVKKMKSIASEWETILAQVKDKKPVDGKFFIDITNADGTVKTVEADEKLIAKLTKKLVELNDEITNKNPFEKIKTGLDKISKGNDSGEGVTLVTEGLSEILSIATPVIDAMGELADATGNVKLANLADDLQIAVQWAKTLSKLIAGIASGDPTKIVESLVEVTANLIKAEAAYQKAKRDFLADNIKMQREYVILLLQERALFEDGTSIFGLNDFGSVANNLGILKDATAEYRLEMQNLSDAMVLVDVKRKKIFGLTVGKKNIYGKLLDEFPELIKNQTAYNELGQKLSDTFSQISDNANIDVNVAKSILATEKLTDEARNTLEQLIAIQEEIDAANQAISDYLSDVFGQIGSDISDALIDAFKNGEDAGIAFADSMSSTMDKLATDIANSMILAPYFKDFENQLNEIYKNINLSPEEQLKASAKLMSDFYSGLKGEQEEYNKFLQQSQDIASQYGIDLFASTNDNLSAITKGLQGLTEDTGRRLEALFNSNREINIQSSTKISVLIDGMNQSNIINGQMLSTMQTMNQNLVGYIKTFNSIITQGKSGTGIKTYMQ